MTKKKQKYSKVYPEYWKELYRLADAARTHLLEGRVIQAYQNLNALWQFLYFEVKE